MRLVLLTGWSPGCTVSCSMAPSISSWLVPTVCRPIRTLVVRRASASAMPLAGHDLDQPPFELPVNVEFQNAAHEIRCCRALTRGKGCPEKTAIAGLADKPAAAIDSADIEAQIGHPKGSDAKEPAHGHFKGDAPLIDQKRPSWPQSGTAPGAAAQAFANRYPGASLCVRIPGSPPLSFRASWCASVLFACAVSKSQAIKDAHQIADIRLIGFNRGGQSTVGQLVIDKENLSIVRGGCQEKHSQDKRRANRPQQA